MTRRNIEPKQLSEVFTKLGTAQFDHKPPVETMSTLKAYSKRLAGRSVTVNKTVFSFDDKGYCVVDPVGKRTAVQDHAILLMKNGITEVFTKPALVEVVAELTPEPAPEPEAVADEVEVKAEEPAEEKPSKWKRKKRTKKENN